MQHRNEKPFCNFIDQLRSSSRTLVRELGFLNDVNPIVGVTMPQLHALIELSRAESLTVVQLADLLKVDKSTASRTVKSLREKDWVCEVSPVTSKRERPIKLTESGQEKVDSINSVCDDVVGTALGRLSAVEQQKIQEGMTLYCAALRQASERSKYLVRPIRKTDNAALSLLITSVLKELEVSGPDSPAEDAEVAAMYQHYVRPGASFFVAANRDGIVGCSGVAPLSGASPEVAELRKFYVLAEHRRLGVGGRLLDSSLQAAREFGYRRVFLETSPRFTAAIALFKRAGFKQRSTALGDSSHASCGMYFELLF